jgi:phosphoribosyl 1,2-cyclic phosphate phosphodiesterase
VPDSVIERIAGVRHLVVDALRHKPHPTHMSVSEALELAEKVAPEQTWLTHLCHELMHAELEPALPAKVSIAHDGMRIEL